MSASEPAVGKEEKIDGYASSGSRITICLPDDFHHHCRDGTRTASVVKHASKRFGRCLMMPNIKPPVTTTSMALEYKQHILNSIPASNRDAYPHFQPLMVLYLTDITTPEEIRKAAKEGIVGCKYYPAGATTNSDSGVTDVRKCYPALEEMARNNMVLCIHSEVTHPTTDIFDREPVFIEEIMKPLVRDFPTLKVVMEHISTKQAVEYVRDIAPDTVKASITCHHLLFNRNHLLVGGIRPHLYCLPILKAEEHRRALLEAATSGSAKFFLGTDSAPHATSTKEASCGCAGVYSAHAAIELYAEAFDRVDALDKLEDFASTFGANHYGLATNKTTLTLEKKSWTVPTHYDFGDNDQVTPLRAGDEIQWSIVE